MVLGVQYQLQHVQAQYDKNHDIVSFKESLLVELDDFIKDLELFDKSCQSILRLKENFKNFNQCQLQYTETILSKKIASEKEKYKANLKICQDKVKKLQIELIDNKQKIVLLEESYKKLNEEYEKIK
ncbi:3504_t:CDS:2 [Gigaspora margarita]|uniref:3504_t:CDS:1 n=1 Tax=Gigaspora margarita TaxID=4874 RepID=A0ABN7W3J6_GIGMA|nr:3504_t:CDS:2 [Gigaspora margarita]